MDDGRRHSQIARIRARTRCGHGHGTVFGQIGGDIASAGLVDGDIDRVNQPFPARTLFRPGFGAEAGKINVVTGGFNTPALTRARRLGLHAALCACLPARLVHIAPQHHLAAIAALRGTGGYAGAFVHIDGAGLAHLARALPAAAHMHGATACGAVGFDLAAWFQGNMIGFKNNLAAFVHQAAGIQGARIDHAVALQRDAACRSHNLALVDDCAAICPVRAARERVFARHESIRIRCARRGDDTAHVHAGGRRKVNARRVAEVDLPVGLDLAVNLAGINTLHAIQGDRAGAGLLEVDRRIAADIEALPVDHGALAGLTDGHGCTLLGDAGLARGDLAARGQLRGCGGRQALRKTGGGRQQRAQQQAAQAQAAAGTALAAPFGAFLNSGPALGGFIPDGAVASVHGATRHRLSQPVAPSSN
ncbi:hypothetical protein RV045_01890 [Comamonadaceae bacterium SL12-8]|uniref:Uncharacterized protein n=1 Tax=Amphibiibacter pelophylacis TaxID=1799477 RepID=A0ACC6NZ25_9BURK